MSKILIIEDDEDFLQVLAKRLDQHGFDYVHSTDAIQAVELAHNERPDMILLDLRIPGGGGLTVLKNLKLSSFTKDIPVVVLTAMRDPVYKQKVLGLGVQGYLEKPLDLEDVIKTIKNVLVQ